MASETCAPAAGGVNEPNCGEDYDERLDFFSVKFEPLLALHTPGLKPPVLNAKAFDNIHKYDSTHNPKIYPTTSKQSGNKRLLKSEHVDPSEVRNFLPHQMPVRSTTERFYKNVITRMDEMKGPLSVLQKCKDERRIVKVWTRHSHGIRGYCQAYVTTFDKHWNIALEDVTEVWTRPKKKKIPATAAGIQPIHSKGMAKHFPEIVIDKSDKKTEICRRHVDQLLIRGEQIVIIVIAKETKPII